MRATMTTEAAQALALEALTWIAGQERRAAAFLDASGLAPAEIGPRAADPDFLGFVLDFLLSDEPALMAFCESCGHRYEDPMAARARLPGGADPHWT